LRVRTLGNRCAGVKRDLDDVSPKFGCPLPAKLDVPLGCRSGRRGGDNHMGGRSALRVDRRRCHARREGLGSSVLPPAFGIVKNGAIPGASRKLYSTRIPQADRDFCLLPMQ
jgi:hypothetical protein